MLFQKKAEQKELGPELQNVGDNREALLVKYCTAEGQQANEEEN